MYKLFSVLLAYLFFLMGSYVPMVHAGNSAGQPTEFRRLPVKEYVDKMKAGWIGQMAGVGWGWPTEFK